MDSLSGDTGPSGKKKREGEKGAVTPDTTRCESAFRDEE